MEVFSLFLIRSSLYMTLATVFLLALDWLVFCTITPNAFVIPGSEGHRAYKDYFFHFRGFLIGTGFSAIMGLIAAGIVAVF